MVLRFVTLGLFIIDEFKFLDDNGEPTGRTAAPSVRPSCMSPDRLHITDSLGVNPRSEVVAPSLLSVPVSGMFWSFIDYLMCKKDKD